MTSHYGTAVPTYGSYPFFEYSPSFNILLIMKTYQMAATSDLADPYR